MTRPVIFVLCLIVNFRISFYNSTKFTFFERSKIYKYDENYETNLAEMVDRL
jgi:hypothetical protein